MRVIVVGGDGFLGWPVSLRLSSHGHEVMILDPQYRRAADDELGTNSLVPIATMTERIEAWKKVSGKTISWRYMDAGDEQVHYLIQEFLPDAVIHFGEYRSAPYSMIDQRHAWLTQKNNVQGTLNLIYGINKFAPNCHLIKLGTMGEYGTPDIDIEEGFIEIKHKGRKAVMPYPMQPGSWYHLSKLHDSNNLQFACKIEKLRVTDLHQGIVYGVDTPETKLHPHLATRFDYDGIWGTVLNRFCMQAAGGKPLTVYGAGGQTRGMLDIRDTLACIELALLKPADRGEYRVFNQFTEEFGVEQLARKVSARAGALYGTAANIAYLRNPRVEQERHYYKAAHTKLIDLGLEPHFLTSETIDNLILTAEANLGRARWATFLNSPEWKLRR